MKIFLDTADISEIREGVAMGMVDGVTTNPSLVAKTNQPMAKVIGEICSIVNGPVSAEAVSTDFKGLMVEAKELSKIHPNVTVKVPVNSEGLKAVKACTEAGIKTNVTLVFQSIQGLLAAKAGATFVSPFVGRLDDVCFDGMDMVAELGQMLRNYNYKTEIIVASVRHPLHVVRAALCGAHVVTLPLKVLKSLIMHPLTDSGIQKFMEDYHKIPKK